MQTNYALLLCLNVQVAYQNNSTPHKNAGLGGWYIKHEGAELLTFKFQSNEAINASGFSGAVWLLHRNRTWWWHYEMYTLVATDLYGYHALPFVYYRCTTIRCGVIVLFKMWDNYRYIILTMPLWIPFLPSLPPHPTHTHNYLFWQCWIGQFGPNSVLCTWCTQILNTENLIMYYYTALPVYFIPLVLCIWTYFFITVIW